jgi:hypothetical protein
MYLVSAGYVTSFPTTSPKWLTPHKNVSVWTDVLNVKHFSSVTASWLGLVFPPPPRFGFHCALCSVGRKRCNLPPSGRQEDKYLPLVCCRTAGWGTIYLAGTAGHAQLPHPNNPIRHTAIRFGFETWLGHVVMTYARFRLTNSATERTLIAPHSSLSLHSRDPILLCWTNWITGWWLMHWLYDEWAIANRGEWHQFRAQGWSLQTAVFEIR